ncbi:NHL repeat-containing protein [Pseudonocardia eucalypti]
MPSHETLLGLAMPGARAEGEHAVTHAPVPDWPPPSRGLTFTGDTASVAAAPDGTVWAFHRGAVPVVQLDLAGRVLRAWGEGQFARPHGITVDRFGDLYLVDEFGHVVEKRSPDGDLHFVLGNRGAPAPWQEGKAFNRPTSVAVHPRSGDIFVADGYGNSRIHRFDRHGVHVLSWGEPGGAIGCFSLPHHLSFLGEDLLVVSDRENFRLQFFDKKGGAFGHWHCHRPCAAVPMRWGDEDLLLIAELGPSAVQRDVAQLGNRLVALDADGRERLILDRHDGGCRLTAPHDVAVDRDGRIFVAEVARSWLRFNFDQVPDVEPASIRRWDPV